LRVGFLMAKALLLIFAGLICLRSIELNL
jgi:hypothetical protein